MPSGKSMSLADASRIQSSQEKGGKDMSSGGFAAKAQSAAATNANAAANSGNSNNGGNKK